MKMSIFLLKPEDTSLQHMIKYGCIYTREKILVHILSFRLLLALIGSFLNSALDQSILLFKFFVMLLVRLVTI